MKKIFSAIMIVVLAIAMVSCGGRVKKAEVTEEVADSTEVVADSTVVADSVAVADTLVVE